MPQTATGMYGGVSADHRREERRARLMAAALEIMGTQGVAATTVTGLCAQARVGPRFFYELFDNLDAILIAVLDDIMATATNNALVALADAPDDVAAKTRAAVGTMLREFTDDPRRARIAFVEAYGNEAMMKRRFTALRALADLVAKLALTIVDVPSGAEPVADAIALIITGGVAELVIVWVDGDLDLTREDLIDTCIELMLVAAANAHAIATRLDELRRERATNI